MGYTNYLYVPVVMDKKKFALLAKELETAAGLLPADNSGKNIVLCDWEGIGAPEFTKDEISFNGNTKEGLDHETFFVGRDNSKKARAAEDGLIFTFCKTARKPYDLMVKLSMLRIKYYFPQCKLSSDGDIKDWKQAKELYKQIFGEAAPKVE